MDDAARGELEAAASASIDGTPPARAGLPPTPSEWKASPAPNTPPATTTAPLSMYYDGDGGIDGVEHEVNGSYSLPESDISETAMSTAIPGVDMNVELNEQQIRALLARNDREVRRAMLLAAQVDASAPDEAQQLVMSIDPALPSQQHNVQTQEAQDRMEAQPSGESGNHGIGTTSAYDASREVVYYLRREDKVRQVREHPIVASVTPDGRTVSCRCGRNVRLNPPWYILKFEQHIVSRNCTFLRVKKPKNRRVGGGQGLPSVVPTVPASSTGRVPDAPMVGDKADTSATAACEKPLPVAAASDIKTHEAEFQPTVQDVTVSRDSGSGGDSGGGDSDSGNNSNSDSSALQMQANGAVATSGGDDADNSGTDQANGYALMSLESLFANDLTMETPVGGDFATLQPSPQAALPVRVARYNAMMTLRDNPSFSRITPDGRIIECNCSKLLVLSAPWNLSRFLEHAKHKKSSRKKSSAGNNAGILRFKKKNAAAPNEPAPISTVLTKSISRGIAVEAALRIRRKNFPREVRWDAAETAEILPCPGLRDEKMSLFVTASVQLTGGSRPRHQIAQELFPHLFPPGERSKQGYQLIDAEKFMLHDVIEGEAVWFVDKDGNSVRALDCKGIIDIRKGETACTNCLDLRSNGSLRTAIVATVKKAKSPRNPLNRKFCSGRVFSLLESEFDMSEEYARILRDLSLVNLADDSSLNTWMDLAEMGIQGLFNSHPALIGLLETMLTMKDKERRGVGMQNMNYSDHLDSFLCSIAEHSTEAYDFFQHHLCGPKQRMLLMKKRKHQSMDTVEDGSEKIENEEDTGHQYSSAAPSALVYDTSNVLVSSEGFSHLLDPSSTPIMPNLTIGDIQDVDLSSFSSTAHPVEDQDVSSRIENRASSSVNTSEDDVNDRQTVSPKNDQESESSREEAEVDSYLSDFGATEPSDAAAIGPARLPIPSGHVPCTGLRDEKVQCYVSSAVQIIGGSRPKYVIARELFPDVFDKESKVKMTEKLNEEQKLVLQDAVFSECMWRVDKVGNCVRSLRCLRVADSRSKGICRACRDLKSIPNFRSVLSRSKMPKNLENIKYVPSVYTESDPFLRKLSKNGSFRGLYQVVKKTELDSKKHVTFWLKCARMGIFGHFRTHPVFEGLVESMVEIKDKERRGVGKQNMQYSKPLDDFMASLASISPEAFELFASKFCGRTLRSQKVKRRKIQLFDSLQQSATPTVPEGEVAQDSATLVSHSPNSIPSFEPNTEDGLSSDHHHLIPADDLLGGSRPTMTSSDLDENQRLMDRMLMEDDVRLSVTQEMQLVAMASGDSHVQEKHRDSGDNSLDPRTYLDADGVLTTEI